MGDKRRYLSRNPRNHREPISMASERTGNAAADGYTVREHQPLKRDPYRSYGLGSDECVAKSLKDENEARWGSYGDE